MRPVRDLRALIRTVDGWPTILDAEQELTVLAALREIGDEVLLGRFDELSPLLARLEESHAGGGVFEADRHREAFDDAARWIEHLARPPLPERHQALLRSVAATLRTRFPSA